MRLLRAQVSQHQAYRLCPQVGKLSLAAMIWDGLERPEQPA